MKIQDIEECLEIIWHLNENHEADIDGFLEHDEDNFGKEAVRELEMDGYIVITNKKITMTGKGEDRARQVVRRHRLAERLLSDVLGMKPEEFEKGACEFEHLLAPELTESICTLLGHPRLCPHGIKIPEGECCKKGKESFASAAYSLTKAKSMEPYTVAYINTHMETRMQKLFQFSIVPGATIMVTQTYPSYVVQCGNAQLAMEEKIAREIYVWRNDNPQVGID